MSDEPRPTRITNSIDMVRYRARSNVHDFGLSFVKRHCPEESGHRKLDVSKHIKTIHFVFSADVELNGDVEIAERFGGNGIGEDDCSESYEGAEGRKRKLKGKSDAEANESKRSRRGGGGTGEGPGGGAGGLTRLNYGVNRE